MGTAIEPNLNCPAPEVRISEYFNSEEGCMSWCIPQCKSVPQTDDCNTGLGTCFYNFDFCGCHYVDPEYWLVYCFYTYSSDSCEMPGGYAPAYKYDIPKTLLYAYAMGGSTGTKYETYTIEGVQKRVIAFRSPKASLNIKIKHSFLSWLNFDVAGELDPDAAGNYTGESESPFDPLNKLPESDKRPSYVGPEREFFIWWDGVDTWYISDRVGDIDNPYWSRVDIAIGGAYNPQNGAEGIATVSVGEL